MSFGTALPHFSCAVSVRSEVRGHLGAAYLSAEFYPDRRIADRRFGCCNPLYRHSWFVGQDGLALAGLDGRMCLPGVFSFFFSFSMRVKQFKQQIAQSPSVIPVDLFLQRPTKRIQESLVATPLGEIKCRISVP